jgi:uncharacterized protein (TIGR03437 family)
VDAGPVRLSQASPRFSRRRLPCKDGLLRRMRYDEGMWRALLLFVAPAMCFAQFAHLATTAAGDRIFFVTPLRQPGQNQFPHDKLFLLDPSGTLRLVYQQEMIGDPGYSNGYAPTNITASGDAQFVAFNTVLNCGAGSSCFLRERSYGSVLDVSTGASVFSGSNVMVSRNGRYVLSARSTSAMPVMPGPAISILDRTTSEHRTFDAARGVIALSSRGDLLLNAYDQGLQLVPWSGAARTIPVTGATTVAIDDSLATLVYSNTYYSDAEARLFVFDLASGRQWQLGPDDRASYGATMSSDGEWVLYRTELGGTPQLMFSHPDSSGWKVLTAEPSGIVEGVLSGDGQVAWAATGDGRLLRIATTTGETNEVLAPPVIAGSSWTVVPGSLLRLDGYRHGSNVQIDGVAAPVVSTAPEEAIVQVPWDLPQPAVNYGAYYVTVSSTRADSPLEAATQEFGAVWSAYSPRAWIAPVHEDWSSLVTAGNPARAGEVLHLYATGMGATSCTLANGQPAPLDRLCTPDRTIDWSWWWTGTDSMPAGVLFAGLAPGLTGLYQIDVRVPENPPAARLKLIADRDGNNVVADLPVQQ